MNLLAVHARMQRVAVARDADQRTGSCERLASTTMTFPLVDEACVAAERDVVHEEPVRNATEVDPPFCPAGERREGGERVPVVDSEVAREVIPGAARDADEGGVELERGLGDRRERAVAARDADDLGARGACDLARILAVREHMRLDPARARRLGELVGGRPIRVRNAG